MEPFAPPETGSPRDSHLALVLGAWGLAGGAAGTLLGATLQLAGRVQSLVPLGLGAAAAFGVAGYLAFRVERRSSGGRPALVDGRGRLVRPMRAWLLGVPLAAMVCGMLGLVVIGSVRAGSLVPGAVALVVAAGLAWFARPLVATHLLTRAVEAAETARPVEARRRLLALERAPWAPREVRGMAQLNLGLLALCEGDLAEAEGWYARPSRGRARAFARTGLALVHALRGRFSDAEEALRESGRSGGGKAAQAEADAVRLLVVLGRDGPDAALDLGERLLGPSSGALFRGVLAGIRARRGDRAGADQLLAGGVRESLVGSGLASVVPALADGIGGAGDFGEL